MQSIVQQLKYKNLNSLKIICHNQKIQGFWAQNNIIGKIDFEDISKDLISWDELNIQNVSNFLRLLENSKSLEFQDDYLIFRNMSSNIETKLLTQQIELGFDPKNCNIFETLNNRAPEFEFNLSSNEIKELKNQKKLTETLNLIEIQNSALILKNSNEFNNRSSEIKLPIQVIFNTKKTLKVEFYNFIDFIQDNIDLKIQGHFSEKFQSFRLLLKFKNTEIIVGSPN